MALVDPGRGSWDAPEGTVEWCKRLRLALVSGRHQLRTAPENFALYLRKALDHRAWTLLTDELGRSFATWDDFCRAREPWGLGTPWSEVKPFLVGVMSERELDIATVAPAKTPDPPAKGKPNRGKRNPDTLTIRESGSKPSGHASDELLRAIAERTPEPARDLYRRGLLGQREAAKLGPKNPEPEQAARVTEIAIELAADAKALDASTEALRKQAQRALNTKARELLGIRSDRVTSALRAVEKMTDDERERLVQAMSDRGWIRTERIVVTDEHIEAEAAVEFDMNPGGLQ